jgi:hypothetical protein
MREPDQKRAFLAHTSKQFRFAREFDENFLQHVTRIAFIAREIQKKGKKRLGVLVVKPLDFRCAGHLALMTRAKGEFV